MTRYLKLAGFCLLSCTAVLVYLITIPFAMPCLLLKHWMLKLPDLGKRWGI